VRLEDVVDLGEEVVDLEEEVVTGEEEVVTEEAEVEDGAVDEVSFGYNIPCNTDIVVRKLSRRR
jgi:hypothetical protein